MKKLIQISIVVVLVLMLFQALSGGPTVTAGKICSSEGSTCFTANTSVQSVQVVTCLGLKGVICVKPDVGWNT